MESSIDAQQDPHATISHVKVKGGAAPLMELVDVSCGYRRKKVLEGVSLKIPTSERLAIIGDNGQGKSTLLKVLLGLLRPDAGKYLCQVPLQKISYVPQHPTRDYLMPVNVGDFVALGLADEKRSLANELISMALKRVKLLEQWSQDISTLSGGQFQRAVLARALVRQPELVFLDEPTTGLDRLSSREFMSELKEENISRQMAYVMIVHDFRYLKEDFDRIAWIHDGVLTNMSMEDALGNSDFLDFTGLIA
jgi:zinc transport system ATP-binding protein